MAKQFIIGFLMFFPLIFSCKKFIDVPAPGTNIMRNDVFSDDATALAALTAVYGHLTGSGSFASGELSFVMGAYSDEFTVYNTNSDTYTFYLNNVLPTTAFISGLWSRCYSDILSTNLIIEGLQKENGVSVNMQNQLKGEALFLRAFCHFYLVNLFGDVPLIKTSDYKINASVVRTPTTQVYDGIIEDLIEAIPLLSDKYPSAGRVRANKGAAIAFLARAYLYTGDYANAEMHATAIIDKESQYKLHENLNEVFLKTSEEAIWQLMPQGDLYTNEGARYILVTAPPSFVSLRSNVYNSFEIGDFRKINWLDTLVSESGNSKWYYASKYKENSINATGAEYSMVFRLAEQYLIRAEAQAQQNKLDDALYDINIIRHRAGLNDTALTVKAEVLKIIEHERQVELFSEWGHRFFDLKRTGRIDTILGTIKPNWKSFKALLPLPQSEILNNVHLIQNPNY